MFSEEEQVSRTELQDIVLVPVKLWAREKGTSKMPTGDDVRGGKVTDQAIKKFEKDKIIFRKEESDEFSLYNYGGQTKLQGSIQWCF